MKNDIEHIEREEEYIYEALKGLEIKEEVIEKDILKHLEGLKTKNYLDDSQLCKLFKDRLDVKSIIYDKKVMTEYRYTQVTKRGRFITNILESFIQDVNITGDEYSILYANISTRLSKKSEEYFTKLKAQVEKMNTEEVWSFLFKNDIDYLKFKKSQGLDTLNENLVVSTLYSYYPWDIKKFFSNDIRNKHLAYLEEKKKASKAYVSQSITKNIDIKMKELLLNHYADRIIEMYKSGSSFRKIQGQLTKECIEKNEIPKTITRYDRSSESNRIKVERPTLLSMNVIKKIILDADIKIQKVGRYSKVV